MAIQPQDLAPTYHNGIVYNQNDAALPNHSSSQGQSNPVTAMAIQSQDLGTIYQDTLEHIHDYDEVDLKTLPVSYAINIMDDDRRMHPRFTLTPDDGLTFEDVIMHIQYVTEDILCKILRIKVHTPTGLREVTDEANWLAAVEDITDCAWISNEVTIVAEMGDLMAPDEGEAA